MPNRYILFQAYGNKGVLLECKLALLQLLKHNDTSSFCVLLYTDNLDFYKEIFQQFNHFSIQPLTKEKITQWRGDIEFAHRVKIEMLLHFFETHTGAVVYFDTDTYCRSSIIPMFEAIEKGSIFMHTYEGNLDNRKSIIFKKWRRFLENNKTILNEKAQKNINELQMWNAGVLGFSNSYIPQLKQVLQLTDHIYPIFPEHTVEQFAFSYIFQITTQLKAADHYIYHYWDLKEYKELLQNFYAKNHTLSLQDQADKLQLMLPELIFREKIFYKKLPFYKKWTTKKWNIAAYLKP